MPVSNWTFADKGSKQVEIAGLDDKHQLTLLLSCTMKGKLLPTQVIYAGKTPACLLKVDYLSDWFLTYTINHWSNKQKHIDTVCQCHTHQSKAEQESLFLPGNI